MFKALFHGNSGLAHCIGKLLHCSDLQILFITQQQESIVAMGKSKRGKCNLCGKECRTHKMIAGLCKRCYEVGSDCLTDRLVKIWKAKREVVYEQKGYSKLL